MLKGGSLVTTFILSIIILKIKPKLRQIVGSSIVLFGILTVGASELFFSSNFGSDADTVKIEILRVFKSWGIFS